VTFPRFGQSRRSVSTLIVQGFPDDLTFYPVTVKFAAFTSGPGLDVGFKRVYSIAQGGKGRIRATGASVFFPGSPDITEAQIWDPMFAWQPWSHSLSTDSADVNGTGSFPPLGFCISWQELQKYSEEDMHYIQTCDYP